MVTWIVQTNVEPESTSRGLLRRACSELGLSFHAVSVVAGASTLPELSGIEGPAVFHGRNTLIRCALEHPVWKKAVFFPSEHFHPRRLRRWLSERTSSTWTRGR